MSLRIGFDFCFWSIRCQWNGFLLLFSAPDFDPAEFRAGGEDDKEKDEEVAGGGATPDCFLWLGAAEMKVEETKVPNRSSKVCLIVHQTDTLVCVCSHYGCLSDGFTQIINQLKNHQLASSTSSSWLHTCCCSCLPFFVIDCLSNCFDFILSV